MLNDINTLSDFFTLLSSNLQSTEQVIIATNIWLITPNVSEVPIIDRSTVLNGVKEIAQQGRNYIENVSATFEIIKFIVKWPKS